jgi:hypothetical protein
MNVKQMIKLLESYPQDAEIKVMGAFDGSGVTLMQEINMLAFHEEDSVVAVPFFFDEDDVKKFKAVLSITHKAKTKRREKKHD